MNTEVRKRLGWIRVYEGSRNFSFFEFFKKCEEPILAGRSTA